MASRLSIPVRLAQEVFARVAPKLAPRDRILPGLTELRATTVELPLVRLLAAKHGPGPGLSRLRERIVQIEV
jgi:hypothetical protein